MKNIKEWNIYVIKTVPKVVLLKHKKAFKIILRMQKSKLFPYSIKLTK